MEDICYLKDKQERILNAIEKASKMMPTDNVVKDETLHKNEKEVELSAFGTPGNLKENPYEVMTDEEKEKFINKINSGVEERHFAEMVEKSDGEIPNKEELSEILGLEDLNDKFDKKVKEKYDKFIGELATGKYPYSAKDHEKKNKIKKDTTTKFKKFRQKVAGDVYKNKLRATDLAAKRNGYRTRVFYGTKFQENKYKGPLSLGEYYLIKQLFAGEYHLEGLQYKEICRFSNVWKLFKFIVREKWIYFISNVYTKLVVKLPNKGYYGYKNLEDMMESTGGKPYTTLLSNKGINPDCMYYTEDSKHNIINLKPEYEKYLSERAYFDKVYFNNSMSGNSCLGEKIEKH